MKKRRFNPKTIAISAGASSLIISRFRRVDPYTRILWGVLGGIATLPFSTSIGMGIGIGGFLNGFDALSGGKILYNWYPGKIWVKPESSNEPIPVKEFSLPEGNIDGIAIPDFKNRVFKVPDGVYVNILSVGTILPASVACEIVHKARNGGRKTIDYFHKKKDYSWDNLFKKVA